VAPERSFEEEYGFGTSTDRNCPYCSEEVEAEWLVCRWCGHDLTSEEAKRKAYQWTPGRLGCAGIAILVLALLVLSQFYDKETPSIEPTKYAAYVMCQEFVKDRLRAPATADFPVLSEARWSKSDGDRWRFEAHVDAQNAFGAVIRTRFHCVVKYAGENKWQLVELDMV